MGSIESPKQPDYDVLVIGAGLSGCYACHRMRELGVKVKVLEAGSSVGGTWFWSMRLYLFSHSVTLSSDYAQIDIQALALTASHTRTGSFSRRRFLTNGNGLSTSHHKRKRNDT